MKKKLSGVLIVSSMMLGFSVAAMAEDSVDTVTTESFDVKLPAYQGNVEVSTVVKESSADHFTITISSLSSGTHVRVWTESSSTGNNYSNPNQQVAEGITSVNYYADSSVGDRVLLNHDNQPPSVGEDVVLNLDNPIVTSSTPNVAGEWTPN